MSTFVIIELEDKAKAEFLVDDTKKTDSMCIVNEQGDEVEFEVKSIKIGE